MKKTWDDIVGGEERYSVPIGTAFLGLGAVAVGGYLDGFVGLLVGGMLLAGLVMGSALQLNEPIADVVESKYAELSAMADRTREGDSEPETTTEPESRYRQRIQELEAERDRLEKRRDKLESQLKQERQQRIGQEKLLEALTQVSRECADGNLSLRLDEDVISEYLADTGRILDDGSVQRELPRSFNAMLDEFESTIRDVESFVELVGQNSDTIGDRASAVESASGTISDRMDSIATGADKQSARLRSAEAEIEQLSENIRTIGGLVSDVASAAEQTVETGHEGRKAATQAIQGVREIESGAGEAVDAIEELHEEMRAIDDLVESISNLAGQTNRLALNANIEASRSTSSKHSEEGFGVVASEVKELAEESQETAESIESRIQRLQQESQEATEKVRNVEQKMATHAQSIETALRALDQITSHAETTNDGIQQIGTATKEQARSTDEVVSLVHQTARISEKTSELTEQTRSTTVEQAETLSTMTAEVDELARAAVQLESLLGSFGSDGADPDLDAGGPALNAVTENLAD